VSRPACSSAVDPAHLACDVADPGNGGRRDALRSEAANAPSMQQADEVDLAAGGGFGRSGKWRTLWGGSAARSACLTRPGRPQAARTLVAMGRLFSSSVYRSSADGAAEQRRREAVRMIRGKEPIIRRGVPSHLAELSLQCRGEGGGFRRPTPAPQLPVVSSRRRCPETASIGPHPALAPWSLVTKESRSINQSSPSSIVVILAAFGAPRRCHRPALPASVRQYMIRIISVHIIPTI